MAEIGKPIDRVDGRLKVTGAAKYAAEFNQTQMAYAFPVRSTIASGSVTKIDQSAASNAPGVIQVLTHESAPRIKPFNREEAGKAGVRLGEELIPLQDNRVHYYGQFVALVVAETYEQARAAAALLKITYAAAQPTIDLQSALPDGARPAKTATQQDAQLNAGKAAEPLRAAARKIEQIYRTSNEVHNAMEPHATVAAWEGADKLTIHDATQSVVLYRQAMAYFFDLKTENVRVINPFVGGGFGSKGFPWTHSFLSVMAAKVTKRPVKLAVTRQMMQVNVGRRGETSQQIALGANQDGKLVVIRHQTDTFNNLTGFFESAGLPTGVLYDAPLREITYRVAKLNIGAPTFMRAPGEAPGSFALESAMDELAFELKIDPLELRVMNHTAVDPLKKIPFSSDHLLECYKIGAEKFGWANRKREPRQMRNGNYLIGMGMATATYPGLRGSTSVRMQMTADGAVKVQCGTQDIGTGTYTIMTQTAADALGIPLEKITVEIGDSNLPPGAPSFGSITAASVTPAVLAAGEILREDLLKLAIADRQSKLFGKNQTEIGFADSKFFIKGDTGKSDSYADIMRRSNKKITEACATSMPASGPGLGAPGAPCVPAAAQTEENNDTKKYSFHSSGAQFVEVWVDESLGIVRVKRVVSVHDAGRILNEKTARSQIIGGVIFSIGQALTEESRNDLRYGNPVQRTFADYHVPVQMDVPEIDVHLINKPDPHISKTGVRGIGEIGGVGVAAAIANAVFNATGKRIRNLPLTPDKLL
jgi:xanthine dehydrogenase YagR molybdenum-binding subunit